MQFTAFVLRREPSINFVKRSKKKKTIVFDLDETLVKSAEEKSWLVTKQWDVETEMDLD